MAGLAALPLLALMEPGSPARAAPAACASAAGSLQQACRLAAAIPEPGSGTGPGGAPDAEVKAPLSPKDFRAVPPGRLAADPRSFLRQPVALAGARCFGFGVGDYRCVVPEGPALAVAAAILIPPNAQVAVEHGCAGSPGADCTRRIFFVPQSVSTVQGPEGALVVFRGPSILVDGQDAAGERAP